MDILATKYEAVTTDWTGALYSRITFDCNYKNKKVLMSMSEYISRALEKFQHPLPDKLTITSHLYVVPVYGIKFKLAQ